MATPPRLVEVAYVAQANGIKYVGMRNEQSVSLLITNFLSEKRGTNILIYRILEFCKLSENSDHSSSDFRALVGLIY